MALVTMETRGRRKEPKLLEEEKAASSPDRGVSTLATFYHQTVLRAIPPSRQATITEQTLTGSRQRLDLLAGMSPMLHHRL